MPNPKKIEAVRKLSEKLQRAKALVLTDYRGLTHRQLEAIRKALGNFESDFTVVKNTLLKKALQTTNYELLTTNYSPAGPTAALIAYGEALPSLKELAKFNRLFQLPTFKIGIYDDRVLTGDELLTLARLPGREVLLGQVVEEMKNPISGLVYALGSNIQRLVLTLKVIGRKKQN